MRKMHIVNLTIINNSPFDFIYENVWFYQGQLADNNSWPQKIATGTAVKIQCYEKDPSLQGCSAWVKYTIQGQPFFFCFSNPTSGPNDIGIGTQDKAWDEMSSQYDNGTTLSFNLNGSNLLLSAHISNTSGDENNAIWELK